MSKNELKINLPLNFNQVVDLVKQLPYQDKQKLKEVLIHDTNQAGNDIIITHLASEKVLAKEWMLPEEDEAWKDL